MKMYFLPRNSVYCMGFRFSPEEQVEMEKAIDAAKEFMETYSPPRGLAGRRASSPSCPAIMAEDIAVKTFLIPAEKLREAYANGIIHGRTATRGARVYYEYNAEDLILLRRMTNHVKGENVTVNAMI